MTPFFCSQASRGRQELMCGTAPRVDRWWLFEYPGPWKPEAIESSRLPLAYTDELPPRHRQLVIRQHYRWAPPLRCFQAVSGEFESRLTRVDLLDYCEPVEFDRLPKTPVDESLFLVCTHGTHDKCCAKFGLPVFHALRDRVGERAWQCSHVGGDRFAGNVVCIPQGVYYGHVAPEDVPALIDAVERDEIYLPAYRGRCCYPRLAQAAEYYLRRETGQLRWRDIQLLSCARTVARFQSADGVYEVELQRSESSGELLTCKSEEPRSIPRFDLVRITLLQERTII